MAKTDKEIILEIEDVRIIKNDPLNYAIERLETNYSPRHKKDFTSYQFKGYYSTIVGALKGIAYKELLIDESSITGLNGHLKQVQESNGKILKAMEGVAT